MVCISDKLQGCPVDCACGGTVVNNTLRRVASSALPSAVQLAKAVTMIRSLPRGTPNLSFSDYFYDGCHIHVYLYCNVVL